MKKQPDIIKNYISELFALSLAQKFKLNFREINKNIHQPYIDFHLSFIEAVTFGSKDIVTKFIKVTNVLLNFIIKFNAFKTAAALQGAAAAMKTFETFL